MAELNQETQNSILEIIQKEMPQHVGGALAERLEQADKADKELKGLKKDYDNLHTLYKERESDLNDARAKVLDFEAREESIKTKELIVENRLKELDGKERALELEMLKKELEYSKQAKADIYNLTDRVFRNHTVRETVMKNTHAQTCPQYADNGTYLGEQVVPNGGLVGEETTTRTSEDQE